MGLDLIRYPRFDQMPAPIDARAAGLPETVNGTALYEENGHVSYKAWSDLLDSQAKKLNALLAEGIEGRADRDDLVRELIAFQCTDGSFALYLDDDNIELADEDDECVYAFEPSYACCQLLTRAYLDGARVEGLEEALREGLTFCGGRSFKSTFDLDSDYEGEVGWEQRQTLHAFIDAGVPRLMELRPDLCAGFSDAIGKVCDEYQRLLDDAATIPFDQYEGSTFDVMGIMEAFGRTPHIVLFTYGSLSTGMANAHLLEGRPYLGRALAEGYRLFDKSPFPVAVDCLEFHSELPMYRGYGGLRGPLEQVMGELRECTFDDLRCINAVLGVEDPDRGYSGKYVLDHADVTVLTGEAFNRVREMHVYLYAGWDTLSRADLVPLQLQPYSRYAALKRTHVWYVCAGPEADPARVAAVLAAGDDPTPPVFDYETTLPSTLVDCPFLDDEKGCCDEEGCRGGEECGGEAEPVIEYCPARAFLVSREQAVCLAASRGFAVKLDELPEPPAWNEEDPWDRSDGAEKDGACDETDGGEVDDDEPYICYMGLDCGFRMLAFASAEQVARTRAALDAVAEPDPAELMKRVFAENGWECVPARPQAPYTSEDFDLLDCRHWDDDDEEDEGESLV